MYLIFDTETTGLPDNYNAPITDTDNWPRCIQIAWQLHDDMGRVIEHKDYLIKPEGFDIPFDSEKIHGISTHLANEKGADLSAVLQEFNQALEKAKFVVGQNVGFDINVMGCEFYRKNEATQLTEKPVLDTCTEVTADLVKIPGGRGGRFKLPTLTELHEYLFGEPFAEAHNATADVEATTRCFFELIRRENFTIDELQQSKDYLKNFKENNPKTIQVIGLKHINLKKESEKIYKQLKNAGALTDDTIAVSDDDLAALTNAPFSHLHNHTQFSILQSTMSVKQLVSLAVEQKMPAVAMTDLGNMMGAFQFVSAVIGHNKSAETKNKESIEAGEEPTETIVKPIVGCELNVCKDAYNKKVKDNGFPVVFLAKNKKGYHNLAKMASLAHTDGFYYVPRIDRSIVEKYKEDIIVLTGGMQGEVPSKILNVGEKQAEEALLWWKEQFADDFYIELMRHDQEDENRVNKTLMQWSVKYGVKAVATNNVFYAEKTDANAHDILLCVKDGEKKDTPIGRGRGFRFGMPNDNYYFKSVEEMKESFQDFPWAIINTQEIVDKIEVYALHRDVLLPKFDIPQQFQDPDDESDEGKRGENNYLRHLTYEGAKRRYPEITPAIAERLDFELATIERTGYPGYFLIVQDFIAAAREMGVSVGPGRGSAAGSAVAYCLGITNLDPIAYDLLFERFLNPDRVSMPDIDIDFDDEGRSKVMQYVIDKYGQNQVAQIITYGKMATKSAIRDTARVLDLPLFEADKLAKLIPGMMPSKWNLARFLNEKEDEVKKALRSDEFDKVKELIQIAQKSDLEAQTINQAQVLEGSLRNTGIHACGVIITPDDITNFVPVTTAKDSELYVTQFDNSVAESAGLLKMDFLGLKTLTLIKDTCEIIKLRTGKVLNPDEFPIDDVKTYELFQRGETVGIFQYESPGMQKYMRELKPTVFADLIAMNALYRPGPLEYIPSFIKRKHGLEPITYDLDACEEYLEETYGITVYQEQVMLLSQKLADFTKGEADVLRKAMGKKQRDVLDKMRPKFIEQAKAKGHNEQALEKIWKDWEAFAAYAFNKSHSTCYAWVAYQTAYLKAHYPAEYMAAVLSNNMNDIKQVTFFMEECRRMGLAVLGPDVNESQYKFAVNDNYEVRFGMGAIKGVGEGAVQTIVENREEGRYKSIFDLAKRIDLRAANKKAFENMAFAGCFDCFEDVHRAQYFYDDGDGIPFFEKVLKYAARFKENENSAQVSLFGEASEVQIPEPEVPQCDEWGTMEKLAKEKEVVGIYISGHPLDDFKYEMQGYCKTKLTALKDLRPMLGKVVSFGGMITEEDHRTSAKGKPWGMFTIEGYDENYQMRLFNDDYLKNRHMLFKNNFVYVKGVVKEGWIDKRTGQPGEPKLQITDVKSLHEVMENYAKELLVKLDVTNFNATMLENLYQLFELNKGKRKVTFEVIEKDTEAITSTITPNVDDVDEIIDDDDNDNENILVAEPTVEYKIKNRMTLPSRNTRVEITTELLEELEQMGVEFNIN